MFTAQVSAGEQALTVRQTPWKKYTVDAVLTYLFLPHQNSIHAYWYYTKNEKGHYYIQHSFFFESNRSKKEEAEKAFRSSVVHRNKEETRIESGAG